jgi:hypothetical protein
MQYLERMVGTSERSTLVGWLRYQIAVPCEDSRDIRMPYPGRIVGISESSTLRG